MGQIEVEFIKFLNICMAYIVLSTWGRSNLCRPTATKNEFRNRIIAFADTVDGYYVDIYIDILPIFEIYFPRILIWEGVK